MKTDRELTEFGCMQFGRRAMQEQLPDPMFRAWERAVHNETPISKETADAIAHAMKTWAMARGVTHFCHWFQPLNGKTAEKHEAFIQPDSEGNPIARFSGSSLLRGETDGSSFPTGGLRETFEARGYTFWDVSSYAYVRGHVLYIPSVFTSYNGERLDLKLPLINAKQALNEQATRVLNLMGRKDVKHVQPMIGLEQEYFLVHQDQAAKRPDIQFCGRALFSADLPKGGEFEDTYFSRINENVQAFMREVNEECWSLGIYAQIEHNEVAPGQYEFSSVFSDATTSIDQNMLLMDILHRVAEKHEFLCLLHEKPFHGMNGSGKHTNFSLKASNGDNLFDPGDRQPEDLQFLVFISAFIEAVDRHQTLIRMASSDAGNDYRLGAAEAPPAIISIHLGDRLHELFQQLTETTEITPIELTRLIAPVISLSEQSIEATDRNRTSPINFSGNKFEFRMLGSSLNPSSLNTFLFAALAQSLEHIADELEAASIETEQDLHHEVLQITHKILKKHHRILFSGDGYTRGWITEAESRGLERFDSYIESVGVLVRPETVELCEQFDILNHQELRARKEILLRQYIHAVKTESRVITRMAQEGVYPALLRYQIDLEKVLRSDLSSSVPYRAKRNADLMDQIDTQTEGLNRLIAESIKPSDVWEIVKFTETRLRPAIDELADLLNYTELFTPYDVFPYPSQADLVVQ